MIEEFSDGQDRSQLRKFRSPELTLQTKTSQKARSRVCRGGEQVDWHGPSGRSVLGIQAVVLGRTLGKQVTIM